MADKFNRKELTNVVFKDYIKRKWIYTASSSEEKIINFINSHEKIIIKPIGLSSGKGIFTVTGNKNQKYDYLLEKLQVSSLSGTELLIEEFIKQHPNFYNSIRSPGIMPNSFPSSAVFSGLAE